jgi:hypothetical protein
MTVGCTVCLSAPEQDSHMGTITTATPMGNERTMEKCGVQASQAAATGCCLTMAHRVHREDWPQVAKAPISEDIKRRRGGGILRLFFRGHHGYAKRTAAWQHAANLCGHAQSERL